MGTLPGPVLAQQPGQRRMRRLCGRAVAEVAGDVTRVDRARVSFPRKVCFSGCTSSTLLSNEESMLQSRLASLAGCKEAIKDS